MDTIRKKAWLITLVSLAVLLLARSLRKDLGSRRQIINEAAPKIQAGVTDAPSTPSTREVPAGAPIAQPLRPSPWSIEEAAAAQSKLLGTVVDQNGTAIAERVLTFRGSKDEYEVRTDREGHFALDTSGEGSFEVIGLGGTETARPVHATIYRAYPGTALGAVVLHATTTQDDGAPAGPTGDDDAGTGDPAGHVAGRVQLAGSGDTPVGAFVVIVRELVAGLEARAVVHHTVLDGRGHFDITGLPQGDYIVQAFASGLAPAQAHATVPVPMAQAELVLELAPGGEVRGQVLGDPERKPLAGARVGLDAEYGLGMYPPAVRLQAIADAQGRFSLPGIGAARGSLEASAPGRTPQVRPQLRMTAGQTTEVELSLRAEGGEPRR